MPTPQHYSLVQSVAPALEPLALFEAKQHLRVDHNDDDPLIWNLIVAARERAEAITDRQLLTATWQFNLDLFPIWDDRHRDLYQQTWRPIRNYPWWPQSVLFQGSGGGTIWLYKVPVQSVTSITYTDTSGVLQTLSTSQYSVDTASEPGRIVPSFGNTWPQAEDVINAVTVTYTAGYGAAASSVPAGIRQAMLLMVGHWYENREDLGQLPSWVSRVLDPYRAGDLG